MFALLRRGYNGGTGSPPGGRFLFLTLFNATTSRAFTHPSSTSRLNASDTTDQRGPGWDVHYRSATEMVWPASKHQEKYAARVYRAFAAVIMSDSKLREQLIEDMGFTIKAIRMSPDHAKAFILWDVYKVTPSVAKHVIQKLTPRLKGGISKAMAAKNVPRLEFKHDKMSVEEEELGRIFQEIEKENK